MNDHLRITITARSGKTAAFEDIPVGRGWKANIGGFALRIGEGHPAPVTATAPEGKDLIASISYDLITGMKNYHMGTSKNLNYISITAVIYVYNRGFSYVRV